VISPARPTCVIAAAIAMASLLLFAYPAGWFIIAVADGLLCLVVLIDLFSLPQRKNFSAKRSMSHVATRGEKQSISVTIANRSKRSFTGILRDDEPLGLTSIEATFPITIPPDSEGTLHYTLVPEHRGAHHLEHVYLKTESRWHLWQRIMRLTCRDTLRVYPALRQIGRYAMYARLNRMSLLGVRRMRRIGTDNEFERLRDYSPDDQFRAIDWRATARRLKMTVRDFQSNQSQRVIFMIDCGRMMVNQFAGQSLLDAAFDAALTLGFVTLRQNDQAGLICFADRILSWLPPAGGKRQLNRMVHATHDIHPRLVESRFDEAFLHLHNHCRKRTLVVLITNVIDDQNANQIKLQAANLVGRHLPLTVLLRDHELFDPIDQFDTAKSTPNLDRNALYRAVAAADILLWRRQVLTELRQSGVLTLDCFPESLTAPLINEYIRIKARHLL
jgi:uncharacterized protein (DUF58 family)